MNKPKKNPFRLGVLETKRPAKGPRTTSVFPRYVAIGGQRGKAARTEWLIDGRVAADYDAAGELIGIAVIG